MCVHVYVCRTVICPEPHPELGFYMEVFALTDITKYDEMFARYGEPYWTDDADSSIEDPHKLTDTEFEVRSLKYYDALTKKYPDINHTGEIMI